MIGEECKKTANNKKNHGVVAVIVIFVTIIIVMYFMPSLENTQKEKNINYEGLNIQNLHNDYENNEINAKDKYTGGYYNFNANIYSINQVLNDNYLTFMFKSDNDISKSIEINAYFNDANDLKALNKNENVTLYCKFKQRSIHNYKGRTTSYSFENCYIK